MTRIIAGSLDKLGHPHFQLGVYGISKKHSLNVDAMLDTGFSGFLNLPLAHCLKTGLVLYSTTSYKLADGRQSSTILCLGTIVLPNLQEVTGVVSIDFNTTETLLGIEFLKKVGGILEINIKKSSVKIKL